MTHRTSSHCGIGLTRRTRDRRPAGGARIRRRAASPRTAPAATGRTETARGRSRPSPVWSGPTSSLPSRSSRPERGRRPSCTSTPRGTRTRRSKSWPSTSLNRSAHKLRATSPLQSQRGPGYEVSPDAGSSNSWPLSLRAQRLQADVRRLRRCGGRVVVVGAGFGGATAAKYIRMWAPDVQVTLVERNREFISCPLSNRVLAGQIELVDLTRGYGALSSKYGIDVVYDEVVRDQPRQAGSHSGRW